MTDVVDRFLSKVEKTESCWIWRGSEKAKGYGSFWDGTRDRRAHRVAYEMFIGPIPDGAVLDHTCRNRRCVNPAHLEAVTNKENLMRGTSFSATNAQKTHCLRGHEFAGDNLHRARNGRRVCRACMREKQKEFALKHRNANT